MNVVGPFDVHRRQLTCEYLETVTGEPKRGRVVPADREHLRAWLARFAGRDDVHFALEGCTGWRYVAEELLAAGITPHLAEPADTAALRGKKRHAKTDKTDARHLRTHLLAGGLPECWIPPRQVLEVRAVVWLYKPKMILTTYKIGAHPRRHGSDDNVSYDVCRRARVAHPPHSFGASGWCDAAGT